MPSVLADIRYALRQLRKSPGFALTAILTLALGIGATTAIFTLVYQVILRSMPVAEPQQLYKVGKDLNCCVNGGLEKDWSLFSTDFYRYFREHTPGVAAVAAVQAGQSGVSERRAGDNGVAQPLSARFVSGNYFDTLGVRPLQGRVLGDADDREGAPPAAVISYAVWQSKFAGATNLVGSPVLLTGQPVTIVGITARNFTGERNQQDAPGLWLPLAMEPIIEPSRPLLKAPSMHWLDVLVRIKNPAAVQPAQLALQAELHQWIAAHMDQFPRSTPKLIAEQTTELASASSGINDLRDQYEESLKLLLLVAGFVLLIACANLANLMLVRGMGRQQELAVRSALGAPRARLVRQMLVEAILLSCLGGAAALVLAYAGTKGILALAMKGAESSPLSATPSLPVLGFALLLSFVTGLVFGIAPAWISSRSNPVEALRGANRSTRDASALPQKLLVIFQAALSLVLLTTSGLLVTSLRALEHQDFHFNTDGRLLLFLDLQAAGYTGDRLAGLYRRFDDSFSQIPGVEHVGYGTYGPMAYDNWSGGVFFPGVPPGNDSFASYTCINSQFFDSLGTRVLAGRGITLQDSATSTHVAVVNQTFANRYFKNKQAVGQHFGPDPTMTGEFEIVGVVEDTKYGNPKDPTRPMFFTPITQTTTYSKPEEQAGEGFKHYAGNLIVHGHGDQVAMAAAVRQTLKQIDPGIAILRMQPYTEQLSDNFTQEELVVRLTTLFGVLALVLASIGLYGVTAYGVARRTSEIGVRMALGASRSGVLAMIVRGALTQALIGLAIGLPLTFGAARLVQHSLYQTSSFQPLVLIAVAAILLMASFIAAVIPAQRAASIDPMRALRTE